MSNIKGTIINVKDFLSSKSVKIRISGTADTIFELEDGRKYYIPDFQREIRWTAENLIELMNDIYHQSKFLGNIILAHGDEKKHAMIDGQQRTTMLLMLVHYITVNYGDALSEPPKLCEFINESFLKYDEFKNNNFSYVGMSEEGKREIEINDPYFQAEHYNMLWNTIDNAGILSDASKAREFIKNLFRCEFNIILSEEESTNYSIEYFLDVNLKGIKLDTEDIFKGYLFHLDDSEEVRQIWVNLKRCSKKFNRLCTTPHAQNECYPLMRFLEHFFYCCIYENEKYSNIIFGEDFCIKQQVQIDTTVHYTGEHILKVINNNRYVREILVKAIEFLKIAINVVETESPSDEFKKLFKVADSQKTVDHDDIAIFHKFIKMILLDRKVIISKAILLKYAICVLLNKDEKDKKTYKKLYAIQMHITLFSVFENKKGLDPVLKMLKSRDWYAETMEAIKGYCNLASIIENKRSAEFKFSTNPENEEQRYRSIMLAAVYNYFSVSNAGVKIKPGKTHDLYQFLTNADRYSTEHFIANRSGKFTIKHDDLNENFVYVYPSDIKKYSASIFNFIFIPRELNNKLDNLPLESKLKAIVAENIDCEYSQLIIETAVSVFKDFPDQENRELLDRYYSFDFKQQYSKYVSNVLSGIADRLKIT